MQHSISGEWLGVTQRGCSRSQQKTCDAGAQGVSSVGILKEFGLQGREWIASVITCLKCEAVPVHAPTACTTSDSSGFPTICDFNAHRSRPSYQAGQWQQQVHWVYLHIAHRHRQKECTVSFCSLSATQHIMSAYRAQHIVASWLAQAGMFKLYSRKLQSDPG